MSRHFPVDGALFLWFHGVVTESKPTPIASTIQIENGIEIPTTHSRYPFEKLKVGDSFAVEQDLESAIRSTATRIQKQLGWKFTCRKVDGRIRVWRIE